MSQADNINLTLPKDYQGKDLFLKIEKKESKPPKVERFRSFAILASRAGIALGLKVVSLECLFKILQEHGLSKTLPVYISLNPTKFVDFDWSPSAYDGPRVWHFKWNDVDCSIASNNGYTNTIWLRVHDLTPGIGEKVIEELTEELLKNWIPPPVPAQIFYTFTSVKTPITQAQFVFQWGGHSVRHNRDINTIYLNKEVKNKLIHQLTKFMNSQEMYEKFGVTWKRVHLLHGPPGSGKSSTVTALASLFNKNIAKLTITPDLDSQSIEALFKSLPANTFLLIEDVDALFTERKSNTSIDFSTILNCMDGLTTQKGLVLFMTTNHVTKLDPAFLRPGRVDLSMEFKLPGQEELAEALQVIGPQYAHEHKEFLDKHVKDMSIAALQKHLFDCIFEERKSILFTAGA